MSRNLNLNAAGNQSARDINWLYHQIRNDPNFLDKIEAIPFVDTPLHAVAAVPAQHRRPEDVRLATEIMRLKPSFAWKLNQDGLSPIHIAIQNGHKTLVDRFIDIDQDLIRVKGKEGFTPLHLVAQHGDIDLLASFLSACPHSIEDVTVESETALHIAVNNGQFQALLVLVRWLRRTDRSGAVDIEKRIINWKDEEGNTILHKAVQLDDLQAVKLLIGSKVDINLKNLNKSTALDIAYKNMDIQGVGDSPVKNMLVRAKALCGSKVTKDGPSFAKNLIDWKITFVDLTTIEFLRLRGNLTDETRNILLVVAVLVATICIQSAQNPPGGVYQANADIGSNNKIRVAAEALATAAAPPSPSAVPAPSHNDTAKKHQAGKSVMSKTDFINFWVYNTVGILISIWAIFILLPMGGVRVALVVAVLYLFYGYFVSMNVISPLHVFNQVTFYALFLSLPIIFSLAMLLYSSTVLRRLERHGENWETKSRRSGDKNKW